MVKKKSVQSRVATGEERFSKKVDKALKAEEDLGKQYDKALQKTVVAWGKATAKAKPGEAFSEKGLKKAKQLSKKSTKADVKTRKAQKKTMNAQRAKLDVWRAESEHPEVVKAAKTGESMKKYSKKKEAPPKKKPKKK